MRRVLITGSNRGIGLDLVARYAQHEDTWVFATCRNPFEADALNQVAAQYPERVTVLQLDVVDDNSIDGAVAAVLAQVDGLDVLINNAGILPGGVAAREPSTSVFGRLDAAAMMQVFAVNSVSPIMVTQAFAALLRKGTNARVINVSSDAGSINRRERGCDYSYPASKAALNMMTRCLAGDLRSDEVIVVSVHPGFIKTDMGGPNAHYTLMETIPSLMNVIDGLTMGDTGLFFNWDGKRVEW